MKREGRHGKGKVAIGIKDRRVTWEGEEKKDMIVMQVKWKIVSLQKKKRIIRHEKKSLIVVLVIVEKISEEIKLKK